MCPFFFLLCFALPHSIGTNLCEVIQRVGIYVWKDAQNSMVPQTKNFEMVRGKAAVGFCVDEKKLSKKYFVVLLPRDSSSDDGEDDDAKKLPRVVLLQLNFELRTHPRESVQRYTKR